MTREEAISWLTNEKWKNADNKYKKEWNEAFDMAIEALSVEAVQGEWINREYCQVDEDAYEVATCSNCKTEITLEYPCDNFCPNCGARMKGEVEE